MPTAPSTAAEHGFTLLEVLIASLILMSVATAGAWAMATASTTLVRSREETIATTAAVERLEQLRGLEWGRGDAGAPVAVSDVQTDLSGPVRAPGGPGLSAASSTTIHINQAGYVDHLDRDGRWIGSGPAAPPEARFTRRWAVTAVAGAPELRLLQVVVTRHRAGITTQQGEAVWLVALKGRKAF